MSSGLTPRDRRSLLRQAKRLRAAEDSIAKLQRSQNLRQSTIKQGEGPKIVDGAGNVVGEIGGSGGLYGHSDRTKPPTPEAPLVEGGVGFLRVTIVEGPEPRDAKSYVIHASTEQGYQVNPGTSVGSILPGDSSVTINLPGGVYHVRAQWTSLSGVNSDASEPVTVEVFPQVDEDRIQEVLDDAQARIDQARADADLKFDEMDARAVQARQDIDQAQQAVSGLESLLETYPDPLSIEESIAAVDQAMMQIGNLDTRLGDAETLIETRAQEASQNLADLDGKLTNSFTQGINAAKQEAATDAQSKADAAKSAAVSEAAQNAQAEYDRLQVLADRAISSSSNMVKDGGFDDPTLAAWTGAAVSYRQHQGGRTTPGVYRVPPGTGNHWPRVTVPVRGGQDVYFEAYARRSAGEAVDGSLVSLYARYYASNGSLISAQYLTQMRTDALPSVGWAQLGATLTTPLTAVTADLCIHTAAGNVHEVFWDDVFATDSTLVIQALTAAQTAQSRADAAHSLAGTAESNAQLAMNAAGQKTRVSYSTALPSGTASEGDVWRRVDANGNVFGEWVRVGSAWQSRGIRNEMISNLDVGKLTAGSATIGSAVIQKFLADGITANTLAVANATVAARNILPNGDLSQGTTFWDSRMTLESDSPPGFSNSLSYSAGNIRANEQRFPLEGGQEYLFEMWVKADKPGSSLVVELRNDSGGAHASASNVSLDGNNTNATTDNLSVYLAWHSPTTTWQKIRTVVKVNGDVSRAYLGGFFFNHSTGSVRDAKVSIAGLRLTSRVDGSLVVENSITADKVHATSEMVTKIIGADVALVNDMLVNGHLFANHASFINAALQTLTVTEKANFADAFADTFWTNNFAARAATISRLIVSAQNLWGDPDFSQGNYTNWAVVNGGLEKNGTGNQNGTYGTDDVNRFAVARGESFVFSADVSWVQGTAGGLGIYRRFVNEWGNSISGYTSQMGPNITQAEALAGRITRTTTVPADVPATAVAMEVGFYTQSNMSSANRVRIENVRIQNALDGRLTVPGTIETEHLNVTAQMTAALLQAKKIEAGEIAGNAFEGGTFTGGIFDGSVVRGGRFETHSAVDQGVKITPDGRITVFNADGSTALAVGSGTFNTLAGRITAYTAPNQPRITLKPAGESQIGEGTTNAGVFFIRDGSSGIPALSVVAGMYVQNPANTGAESLRLRGQNGGSVVIDTDVNFDARGSQTDLGHTIITPGTTTQGLTVRSSAGNDRFVVNNGFTNVYNNMSVPDNFSIRSVRTTALNPNAHIDSNGIFYRNTSASRFKLDQQVVDVPDEILNLDVKDWIDKHALDRQAAAQAKKDSGEELDWVDEADLNPTLERATGLVAEDVEAIDPRYVVYDQDGRVDGLNYTALSLTWLPIVRRQRDRITELEGTVENLEARLAALEAKLS